MELITDKQSREIAHAALKTLQAQQITNAESVRELMVENPFQFINEICRETIKWHESNSTALSIVENSNMTSAAIAN